jgi:hypothetical protein
VDAWHFFVLSLETQLELNGPVCNLIRVRPLEIKGGRVKGRVWQALIWAISAYGRLAQAQVQAPAPGPGPVPLESSIPAQVLSRLAADDALADSGFLARPRLTFDKSARFISYDPNPVPPNLVLSSGGADARALEILVRVHVLRRDFTSGLPGEKFWQLPLNDIEAKVSRCRNDPERRRDSEDKCLDDANDNFHSLERPLQAYADAQGFGFHVAQPERDPVVGYRVHIDVGPPAARLRIMTLLEYKKSKYLKLAADQYRWNDILDADNDMIGWYHYQVAWPAALGGAEEGDFEIVKPSTIAFKAPQK